MSKVTLYHGTSFESADRIRSDGVIKAGQYYGGIAGVALTPRREVAEDFACDWSDEGYVFEVEVDCSELVVDPESSNDTDVTTALENGTSVYYVGGELAI